MQTLIVCGLGNPGIRYQNTLHNVGFRIVEKLAAAFDLTWKLDKTMTAEIARGGQSSEKFLLVKPLSYMNLSGTPVKQVLDYYRCGPESLLVVSDDADLPLGEIRFRKEGGTGGHNGLKSIEEALKTSAYRRLKFGIGHPRDLLRGDLLSEKPAQTLAEYVLEIKSSPFWEALDPKLEEAVKLIKNYLS